jgi:hypothetical protein
MHPFFLGSAVVLSENSLDKMTRGSHFSHAWFLLQETDLLGHSLFPGISSSICGFVTKTAEF